MKFLDWLFGSDERVLPIKTMDDTPNYKYTPPNQCNHVWNHCSPEQCIRCGKYKYY